MHLSVYKPTPVSRRDVLDARLVLVWQCVSMPTGSLRATIRSLTFRAALSLPALSLLSGLSVVVCCSHSHWPWTDPFPSSLDGRSVSPPSESYTQRCLCQWWGPSLKKEVMVRLYKVLMVTQPQNIIPVAAFFPQFSATFYLFSPLQTGKECNGNHLGPAFTTEVE